MAMRPTITSFCRAAVVCLAVITAHPSLSASADRIAAAILVKDALTTPGKPVAIETQLAAKGLLTTQAMGGEPLDLEVSGEVVATGMTGGDGRVVMHYSTNIQGVIPLQVRIGKSMRVLPAAGSANLVVWEQRNPIVVIELEALMDKPPTPDPFPSHGLYGETPQQPMPDAANELAKLTQFYYRVIYVVSLPSSDADPFRANAGAREWLHDHQFPPGYVLVLPPGIEAVGAKLDELHDGGWKTINTGIGRSRTFVDAFLQRRLDAVMVRESNAVQAPRKAKVARDWKEVRKKL